MRNTSISFVALFVVAMTAGVLWLSQGAVTSKEATWDDAVAEAEQGGYRLITTDDLWKRYSQKQNALLLVDTRQEWEYRTGHIEGAVNFPMEPTWLARWQKKRNLGRLLGTDKDRTLIFY